MADERSRQAVEIAERYADKNATEAELRNGMDTAELAIEYDDLIRTAASATASGSGHMHFGTARTIAEECAAAVWHQSGEPESNREEKAQSDLMREIFGNPFRPVTLDPAWQTSTTVSVVHAAYDNRTLPAGTLDAVRLAILADALEDAGCDNRDILDHLRSPGPHVLGCWVLDLLLEKW